MSDTPSDGSKRKASKPTVLRRLTEIWRIRLDGAAIFDVTEYVAEQEETDGSPWKLAEGERPLSRRQIERYVQRVDEMIAESTKESRKRSLIKHLARREAMYGKAMNAGDVRTALAVADSEAKLRGLFPADKHKLKLGGNDKAPLVLHVIEEVVGEPSRTAREALVNLQDIVEEVIVPTAGQEQTP